MPEFAPGIPLKHTKEVPRISSPEIWRLAIQKHNAKRAGCFPATTNIVTDHGLLRICNIVDNKLNVNVKSYNLKTKKFEWKPIINWFRNGSTKEWVHLIFKGHTGLILTPDHEIYKYINNTLILVPAKTIREDEFIMRQDIELPEDLKQFIYGAYLGDGCIGRRNSYRPNFRFGQADNHKEYVQYFSKRFNSKIYNNKKNFHAFEFHHLFNKNLADLYLSKKSISIDFLKQLDERALAAWYMDDGAWCPAKSRAKKTSKKGNYRCGRTKYTGRVRIFSCGFSYNEHKLLQQWLHNSFHIDVKIYKDRLGYYTLNIYDKNNIQKFFNLIKDYVHSNLQYKVPDKVGKYVWSSISKNKALYPVRVSSVKIKCSKSLQSKYDLEIADNHNYFASGILVSNSHYDIRIINPVSNKAYSFATRQLPINTGDKVLAKLQPVHTAEYATWSGKIESGYGAGTVKLFDQDKIEVTKADLEHITFNVYKTNGDTERYALIHTGGDDWLFMNTTATRITRPEVPSTKPSYKSIPIEQLTPDNPKQIFSPKIDGALNAFVLRPDKAVEVYSYRPSVKSEHKLIDHTFRLPYYKTTVPRGLGGKTVLLGEVFARDRHGNVLSNTETASRLLSNVWRSRELQKTAPLDNVVYNILRYKGRDVSQKPYSEKLKLLEYVTRAVPQLKLPPLAQTPEQKTQLLKDIKGGKHSLSREGIVVYDVDQHTPLKSKIREDFDIHVRGTFPGEGRLEGTGAGGFEYSLTPKGPIVGRVGSGFSDEQRTEMRKYPERFKGQVARVLAEQQLPSGALRVPIFKDFRSELWKKTAHYYGHSLEIARKYLNIENY